MEELTYLHLAIVFGFGICCGILRGILEFIEDSNRRYKALQPKPIIPKYRIVKKEFLNNRVEYEIEEFCQFKKEWLYIQLYKKYNILYTNRNPIWDVYETVKYSTLEEAKILLEKLTEQNLNDYANTNTKTTTVVLESKTITN